MKALDLLRYTDKDSGPIGYNTRMALIALLPIAPMVFLNVDPHSSLLTKMWFWLAMLWIAAVGIMGVRELWNSIWNKHG